MFGFSYIGIFDNTYFYGIPTFFAVSLQLNAVSVLVI